MTARSASVIALQDPSGSWMARITRPCSHSITSPRRWHNEQEARRHGEDLLLRSRCLTCALEERAA